MFFKTTRLPPPIIFICFIDELTSKGVARADVTASRAGVDLDAATMLLQSGSDFRLERVFVAWRREDASQRTKGGAFRTVHQRAQH